MTKDWLDFIHIGDFKIWLETKEAERFSFKVGTFNRERFKFDQLGYFFSDFIPDAPLYKNFPPISSVLGEHTYQSVMLDAKHLFDRNKVGFLRQGDFLRHGGEFGFPKTKVQPDFWIVASQTCTISNDYFASIIPVYLETCLLNKETLESLGIRPPNPPSSFRYNKKPRILALPPHDALLEVGDEYLFVDLGQSYNIECSVIKSLTPMISLTFPGNAYFCSRMAMYNFRDLKNWDDLRKPN